jgi:signal transduction histidine kinase
VTEVLTAREASLREQTVAVDVGDHGEVLVHKASLVSMLTAILTNAMRYSPPGSLVEVRLIAEEGALHIEVEDSGPGMSPEEISRLGEPFFRGASSIGIPGSGLGIATCFELAKLTKSNLLVTRSSNPDRGLLVTISLPWFKPGPSPMSMDDC